MKLISPDNVNQNEYSNSFDPNEYVNNICHIYANNIHYTLSSFTGHNLWPDQYNIFNIFNLHNPLKNNAYSMWADILYIVIDLNKHIKGICRLEIFPDRVVDYNKNFCPGFKIYRIYTYYDNNDSYEDSGESYYNYSQSYIYNDKARCYQPQIINFDPTKRIHQLDLFIISPVGNYGKGYPYNKISYVKIYQKISYDSYLLHSLVDDNLYQFNDDRSFTNIISYNDYINKTTSEKKEFFEKINCDKELSQLDKDIFHKFKIIKLDKDNIS